MSLHYVLDGYNVLNKIFLNSGGSLEDSRMALIRMLEVQRPQGSLKNSLTVVFDGKAGFASQVKTSTLDIVFTQGETADDWIKAMVARARNPKNIVVVTEDNEIKIYARHCHAKVLGVKDFFGKTQKKQNKQRSLKTKPQTIQRVSNTEQYRINAELRKIWINEP